MAASKSQRVIVSGSIAYDNILVFDGHFKDHILPDKVHMLNVSFLTLGMRREFGGTAANIAYNLKMLGGDPFMLAAVGKDSTDYLARMNNWGLDTKGVVQVSDAFTAQAFITTDLADNQITAFHPGAMSNAHESLVKNAGPSAYGLISPNGKSAMLDHAKQCHEAGIPYFFDPGQGMPMFDGAQLQALVSDAYAVTVNDYEAQMLIEKTGWSAQEIASKVTAFIVTKGAQGCDIHLGAKTISIAAAPISKAVDPTGCGDAFRAGLLFGLVNDWGWELAAKCGSVLGAIKIEHAGAQNHSLDFKSVSARMVQAYQVAVPALA
jgi:adenosine kinase